MNTAEAVGGDIVLAVLRAVGEWDELADRFRYSWTRHRYNDSGRLEEWEPHYAVSVDCSDVFHLDVPDFETVRPETLVVLESTIREIEPLWKVAVERDHVTFQTHHREVAVPAWEAFMARGGEVRDWLGSPEYRDSPGWVSEASEYLVALTHLFVVRVRKMRPHDDVYKVLYPEALWPLFDAAGPERLM